MTTTGRGENVCRTPLRGGRGGWVAACWFCSTPQLRDLKHLLLNGSAKLEEQALTAAWESPWTATAVFSLRVITKSMPFLEQIRSQPRRIIREHSSQSTRRTEISFGSVVQPQHQMDGASARRWLSITLATPISAGCSSAFSILVA